MGPEFFLCFLSSINREEHAAIMRTAGSRTQPKRKLSAASRERQKRKPGPTVYTRDHRTIPNRAKQAGVSEGTLRKMIKAHGKPKVTRLSPRRQIISDEDFADYMENGIPLA
jgi:hypothetical protein